MNRKNIVAVILILSIFVILSGCTASPKDDISTNNVGTIPSNAEIPTNKIIKNSETIAINQVHDESGGLDSNGNCCGAGAGDNTFDVSTQYFLSYDITEIPKNATITDAKLDFSKYIRDGDPFSYLGCLNVYQQDFDSLDSKDFFIGTPTNSLAKWCSEVDLKDSQLESTELAKALQSKVGQKRFQARLQFDKSNDNNKQNDDVLVSYSKIIVTYVTK